MSLSQQYFMIIIKQVEPTTKPKLDKRAQKQYIDNMKNCCVKVSAKAKEIVIEDGKEKTVYENIMRPENVSRDSLKIGIF